MGRRGNSDQGMKQIEQYCPRLGDYFLIFFHAIKIMMLELFHFDLETFNLHDSYPAAGANREVRRSVPVFSMDKNLAFSVNVRFRNSGFTEHSFFTSDGFPSMREIYEPHKEHGNSRNWKRDSECGRQSDAELGNRAFNQHKCPRNH